MLLLDLGVPGNIDPAARRLAGVQLVNLDDLQAGITEVVAGQEEAIASAQAIVQEEAGEFEDWLEIIPVISELHKKAEAIRQREVARTLRRLPGADPQLSEMLEVLSQSLVNKLLHEPTMHLRKGRGQAIKNYSQAIETLFDLPAGGDSNERSAHI